MDGEDSSHKKVESRPHGLVHTVQGGTGPASSLS